MTPPLIHKVYTRTGDDGTTGLARNVRVKKQSQRIHTIGTIDELNAFLGFARLVCPSDIGTVLGRVQNELFDLGANLAAQPAQSQKTKETKETTPPIDIHEASITQLERDIDRYNASCPPLTSFILPGGTEAAARLHMARTVARRAERHLCALDDHSPVSESVPDHQKRYLNRLSDLLFVLARATAQEQEILWEPMKSRNKPDEPAEEKDGK